MALRDWRLRRVVGLSFLWLLAFAAAVATYTALEIRRLERKYPDRPIHFTANVPGAAYIILGPPLLLLVVWAWTRRSRPAS